MSIPIFQSNYFPCIQYISKLYSKSEILIEVYDTYSRQSYQNRCHISGPNGLQALSIPVEKPYGSKTQTKDIRIQGSSWQENHLRSIKTAYKNSPFYEYYINDFLPFFIKNYCFLIDLNTEILKKICEILELELIIEHTTNWQGSYKQDYREQMHPKTKYNKPDDNFNQIAYHQMFEDKNGFLSNLSFLDLIFNEGPMSFEYLIKSIK